MIGSREWMNLSNGKLSFKEKSQIIKQVLLPATLNYSKTFFKIEPQSITIQFNQFKIHDPQIV